MEIIDLSQLNFSGTNKKDCKSELQEVRWPDSFLCRACGHRKAYLLKKRLLFECANKQCRKQTSATAGTQFHGLRTIPEIWRVLRQERDRISELTRKEVQSLMCVTLKSAKRALQRIMTSPPPADSAGKITSITWVPELRTGAVDRDDRSDSFGLDHASSERSKVTGSRHSLSFRLTIFPFRKKLYWKYFVRLRKTLFDGLPGPPACKV